MEATEQRFPSKISKSLVVYIIVVLLIVLIPVLNERNTWPLIIILGIVAVLVFYIIFSIHYIIHKQELIIRYAWTNQKIDIKSIRKIKATKNIIAAPAASLDRIEITYNQYDHIILSPRDKIKFIQALIQIQPEIEQDFI